MSYGVKAAERIAGKTVLLTGASSGIGEATAFELASAAKGNIRLILGARRLERLEDLKSKLEKEFSAIKILPTRLDVSDYTAISKYLSALPKDWADIDVLVNNAGLAKGTAKVGEIAAEDLKAMYFTNVLGTIELTNALLPHFRTHNKGDIVMVGSIAGIEAYPGGSIYCATKSSLRAFTNSLRQETIDSHIRVMEVDPGAVETEFSLVRYGGDKEKSDNVYKGTEPLTATDIAEIITFALTRRSNTVLAQSLVFPSHQAGSAYRHRN